LVQEIRSSKRNSVEEGRFSFDVIKQNIEIQKENIQKEKSYTKEEVQKKDPLAYELWTKSNDEFLENYWNDKSNKQSRGEKIQELSKKLGRNKGAIRSRLNKMGLDQF